MAASSLAFPYTIIYKEAIDRGIVPDIYKISRIIPVYENGSVCEPGNYGLIATIS